MPVSGVATLTIYDEGWQRPRTIPASQIVATWAVNQPATLSAIVTLDDVARLGRTDVVGAWMYWEHPMQGVFGGIIDDDPSDLGNGTIAITATGIGETLLMDRTTPVLLQPDTGHAGALIRRAMTLAQTGDPLPFASVQWDESGPVVEVEWRGEPIWDVINSVLDQTGQELQITVDRDRTISLVVREQIGEDVSDRVLISEGYQVAGGRVDHSRLSVTNDIIGIASDEDFERSAFARIENETSRARYGRRQAVRRYDDAVSPLAVMAKVRTDIRNEATAPHLPTITLPPMHPVGLNIREGNTVRYWSRSRNRELLFRVMSRTIRDEALEIAGIAEEVRVPPVVPPFTPDLLSGLIAWYDAADLDTLTIGNDVVIAWQDKSPQANTLTSDVFNYSTYDARRSVVQMGASGFLSASMSTGGVLALTMIVVATPSDAFADELIGFPDATFTVADLETRIRVNGSVQPSVENAEFLSVTSDFLATDALTVAGPLVVLSAIVDRSLSSNEATLWTNGTSAGTRPHNGNSTTAFTNNGSILLSSSWDIAEVVIFDHALSIAHREAVEGYLTTKWRVS